MADNEIEQINDERLWEELLDAIDSDNVIPVIGPEMFMCEDHDNPGVYKDIHQVLINRLGKKVGISDEISSFSELVFNPKFTLKYIDKKNIYSLLDKEVRSFFNDFFKEPKDPISTFPDLFLIKRLLETRKFPFVITTSFFPFVEFIMRKIYGTELRTLFFVNNKARDNDIKIAAEDLKKPTIYYMFGRSEKSVGRFAVTDSDMLHFTSSWLDPGKRPERLCDALHNKYILALGNGYPDWLLRFIWFSIRFDKNNTYLNNTDNTYSKIKSGGGCLANESLNDELIHFMRRLDVLTSKFRTEIINKISVHLESKIIETTRHPDVFISYSRRDGSFVSALCDALEKRGKSVWYDKGSEALQPGDNWDIHIRENIKNSKYFIPVFTNNIIVEGRDPMHWYRREWKIAAKAAELRNKFILPVAENDFTFENAIKAGNEIPDEIMSRQILRFSGLEDADTCAEKLIQIM